MTAKNNEAASHGGDSGKANHLVSEKSPYLLQHVNNPVDWHPWGDEAFNKAMKEDKPIFLSIGYSTCHWCHVMAHESFEDSEVAALMNDVFVSIKVDREERPDIDKLYMEVCQMVTGSGGWPLTIIMSPDRKPFFAATYLPKSSLGGRIGMLELIPRVKELWENNRSALTEDAEKISTGLKKMSAVGQGKELGEAEISTAVRQFNSIFDSRHGGFGHAPKFPTPHNLLFLLRYWKQTGDEKALQIVEKTLVAMRMGGVYDHVGFGFHRYSTDQEWLLPHFEKMLYDQALLAMAYIEAYQATSKEFYADVAKEIFAYVLREMTAPEGAFYSAEDADSEGEEGKFYVWTDKEIIEILGDKEARLFMDVFSIDPEGNFRDEASGRQTGTNILHLRKTIESRAEVLDISVESLRKQLEESREKLFAYREKRVRPGKDDKILTDWNGLMISAFAKGAQAFDEPALMEAAERATEFVLSEMKDTDGRLLHRYREGQAAIPAYLDDYAFMVMALLDLYETTFDVEHLKAALDMNSFLIKHFWDENGGGLYFTTDDADELLVRSKEIYDGAVPSGNSVAALNLMRLAHMTGDSALEEKAIEIGKAFSKQIQSAPAAHAFIMMAVGFGVWDSFEIVIVGDPEAPDTLAMAQAFRKQYTPNAVAILKPTEEKGMEIINIAPFTEMQAPIDGKATAYVCVGRACKSPTTEIGEMLKQLETRLPD